MSDSPSELVRLKNIGDVTAGWLNEIGIYTEHELRSLGAVEAYRRISLGGRNSSLNLLYALHGALTDTPWNRLPRDTKERLRREVDAGYTRPNNIGGSSWTSSAPSDGS